MLDMVLGLPEQMAEAAARSRGVKLGRPVKRGPVMVAGMGGSAIGADLARGLFWDEVPVSITTLRDYRAPAALDRSGLFVAVSYSGNTEETVTAFRDAVRARSRVVCITSGGTLAAQAARHGIPVVPVPGGLPPRAAVGHLFVSLLVTLERLGFCRSYDRDLAEAVGLAAERRAAWHRRAARLAGRLLDRLPLVYSTSRLLDPVADRWRCQLNENAKVMCHTSYLPEHNHNEIVGMGAPGLLAERSVVVGLLDRDTNPRTALRWRHLLAVTRGGYRQALALESEGRFRLARLVSLLMLGDLVSCELARLRGVDPLPVNRIDELKRRMARSRRQA